MIEEFKNKKLLGYVQTTYNKIASKLGPCYNKFSSSDDIKYCWVVEDKEGKIVAALHDWKLETALDKKQTYNWHIKGETKEDLNTVIELLNTPATLPLWNME